MSEPTPVTRAIASRAKALTSGTLVLVALGYEFAWTYSLQLCVELRHPWLASELGWQQRLDLCWPYAIFFVCAFFPTLIAVSLWQPSEDAQLSLPSTTLILAISSLVSMTASYLVVHYLTWYGFANNLIKIAIILFAVAAALGMTLVLMTPKHDRQKLAVTSLAAATLTVVCLFKLADAAAATRGRFLQDTAGAGLNPVSIDSKALTPPWRVLMALDDRVILLRFSQPERPQCKVIPLSSVEIGPLDERKESK